MIKKYDKFLESSDKINESYGKNVLSTFMKCLTALGFKDNSPESKDVPSEFLIFFRLSNIESVKVKSVFSRFKSLSSIEIDESTKNVGIYFGIRNSLDFEYGIYYNELSPIGSFKLNKSSYNSIKLSELKSLSGLKEVLVNLTYDDIVLLCKIKNELDNFKPGFFEEKMIPKIDSNIITFGYYGYGTWKNGYLENKDIDDFKSSIKSFLSKYKWSDKLQISINPYKFWIYLNIKIKR